MNFKEGLIRINNPYNQVTNYIKIYKHTNFCQRLLATVNSAVSGSSVNIKGGVEAQGRVTIFSHFSGKYHVRYSLLADC